MMLRSRWRGQEDERDRIWISCGEKDHPFDRCICETVVSVGISRQMYSAVIWWGIRLWGWGSFGQFRWSYRRGGMLRWPDLMLHAWEKRRRFITLNHYKGI